MANIKNIPNNPIYNTPIPVDLDFIFEDKKQHVKLEEYIKNFVNYDEKYPRGLKQAYDEAQDKKAFYSELAEFIKRKGISGLEFLVEVLEKSSEERTNATDLINEIELFHDYSVAETVPEPGPLYNEIQTELKFEDFFEEEEIKKLRRFIEDTAGVLLRHNYGYVGEHIDNFYESFKERTSESESKKDDFYIELGGWLKKNKKKDSEDLDLLIDLLKNPSKRTQEELKRLKTIIDEHSASTGEIVYSSGDDENAYAVPVSVTEGEDGEPLYATPNPKPKIKFKKTRDFPGFWGDEDKGLEGGDY